WLLGANIVFHAGQAWIQAPEKSLYRNREAVATAVRLKAPEMFAHRRPFAIDGGPLALDPAGRPYDAAKDIQFANIHVDVGPRGAALWTLTLRNNNPKVAYRDVHYMTHYMNGTGREVYRQYNYVQDIFQPGTATNVEIIEGFVDEPFTSTTIEVAGADALLPLPR
ncbi:MAG TPA: hypothetical protein VHZ73_06535, partial [Vicinamibacterales bacterium]|nr:hypothetical protein [Vicinamibacterales bacterium]